MSAENLSVEETAAEVVSSAEQTSGSESGVPLTTATSSDMSSSTQDISSMQSSSDNLDMSIIEHPDSSGTPSSPLVPETSEGSHEGAYATESAAGSTSDVSLGTGESPDESDTKDVEEGNDEENNKEALQSPPLDTLHANVAAPERLGTAAAPSTLLVERSHTPIPLPPPTPAEEAEITTQLPEPTTEETEITAKTGVSDPQQEVPVAKAESKEPELSPPQSRSTLETPDEGQSQSIYDSGVLVPEHAEQANTQPQSPHVELSESVVLVSHLDVCSSNTETTATGPTHDGSSDTAAHNSDYGITSIHSTQLASSESVEPCSSAENPSLSGSLSLSELSTLDDEDLEEIEDEDEAEREWRESLKELELLASMVLVPFVGKWVGRRCAYWGKSIASVNRQTSVEELRCVK